MSKIIVKSSSGMMGRSDTRIYNPRSESSYMFRHNNADEETLTGHEDGKHRDEMLERKKQKRKERAGEMKNLKHIKVKPSDLPPSIDDNDEEEEDDKLNSERDISAQTGPSGNMGFLTSLAAQAKGPGAAGGHAFATGEPMDVGVRLLKRDERQGFVGGPKKKKKGKVSVREKKAKKERAKKWRPSTGAFEKPPGGMTPASATGRRAKARMRGIKGGKKTGLGRAHLAVEMSHRGVKTKQPISKNPRRYRQYMGQQEGRQRLGGIRVVHSTPARFGARSYKAGRTGAGQLQGMMPGEAQLARRPPLKPHRPPPLIPPQTPQSPVLPQMSMPSPPPIPQADRGVAIQNMARQSPIFQPNRVPTSSVQGGPSQVMMGKVGVGSDIQKRGLSYYDTAELRQLVNEARRALKRKETKKKGKGTKDTSGAGSNLPKHPENGPKQTTRPEGATEDAKNEPRTFGMDPIGHLVGRGGRTP